MVEKERNLWQPPKWLRDARVLLALAIFALFLPAIITRNGIGLLDFRQTGQIGDTIGGILSPVAGFFAAILTYMAFYEQFRANEQTRRQFEIQRIDGQFGRLLETHLKVQEGYSLKLPSREVLIGRGCLSYWLDEFLCFRNLFELIIREEDNNINENRLNRLLDEMITEMVFGKLEFDESVLDNYQNTLLSEEDIKLRRRVLKVISDNNRFKCISNLETMVCKIYFKYNNHNIKSTWHSLRHIPFMIHEGGLLSSINLINQMIILIRRDVRPLSYMNATFYESLLNSQLDASMSAIYIAYLRSSYGKSQVPEDCANFILENVN